MPFTFSHPAIVIPLKPILKNKVSLTGLIVGSITPDFEYFLRMRIYSEISHSLWGAIWFDLPLAVLLCFIFHQIIKYPLIANLPKFVQYHSTDALMLNWKTYFSQHWLIVCLSILIGIYSHILWDSFTHSNAFFAMYFGLNKTLLNTGITTTKILQHISTFGGAIIICLYFFQSKTQNFESIFPKLIKYKQSSIKFWLSIFLLTLIFLSIRFLYGLQLQHYGNVIVSIISSSLLAVTLVSFHIHIRVKKL